jgi:hypothetical protein
MSTRRITHWWFRFVFSGRFVATFIGGRHRRPSISCPQSDPPRIDEVVGGQSKALEDLASCHSARHSEDSVGSRQ